jgi:hypothetical protein
LSSNYQDLFKSFNFKDFEFTYGAENVECLSDFLYAKDVIIEKSFVVQHKNKLILLLMFLLLLPLVYIFLKEAVLVLFGIITFVSIYIIKENLSKKKPKEIKKSSNSNSVFILRYEELEEDCYEVGLEVITKEEDIIENNLNYYEYNGKLMLKKKG